jgi:hypothetical protein
VAREFNLEREELDARVLGPWVRGHAIEVGDRRWSPQRATIEVYEGRALATEEIGMGRGWANVTRTAEDVTGRVLEEAHAALRSPPALEQLKSEILARSTAAPLGMEDLVDLVGGLRSDLSANERIELAARAVWELLREGRLNLARSER